MIKGIHHISMKCTKEEFGKVKDFYLNILGLKVCREWPDGIMIDCGNALIEIFCTGEGEHSKGIIRHVAFATDDVDGMIERVKEAGFDVFIEPNDKIINSEPPLPIRMAFCHGPLGEEVEFFKERNN